MKTFTSEQVNNDKGTQRKEKILGQYMFKKSTEMYVLWGKRKKMAHTSPFPTSQPN